MKSFTQSAIVVAITSVMNPAFGEGCPVTAPGNVDNDAITVTLPEDRKFVFRPDGPGFIDKDGALGIKVGFFRIIQGQLDVTGRRIDAQAPRARLLL